MKIGDGMRGLDWQSPESRAHDELDRARARRAAAEAEAVAREAAVAADQMPREPHVGDAVVYYSASWGWIPGTILEVVPAYHARVIGDVVISAVDKRDNPGGLLGHWSEQPMRAGYGPLVGNWRYERP